MKRTQTWLAVAASVVLVLGAVTPQLSAKRLDDTAIRIEINGTDGDAGIQIFLDGEGWNRMKVFDPNGRKVLNFRASGSVGMQGITELFFESAEPSFDEQPLDELLALFPEGKYRFVGETTEGVVLKGRARLTHDLPDTPILVFPVDTEIDPGDAVFEWALVADPPGSEIVGYEVIVVCEEPGFREFTADLGPTDFSVTVPEEFLEDGEECKWEVLAIEESGNQTIAEAEFELE